MSSPPQGAVWREQNSRTQGAYAVGFPTIQLSSEVQYAAVGRRQFPPRRSVRRE
jgi:hypothetical protein